MGYEWLEIGGLRIYSRFMFDILLHKDGKFITLTKAYEEGIISLQNIVGITVIHYNYDEQIHHKLDKCTYCLYPISFNIKDVQN